MIPNMAQVARMANDDWQESKHPRADNGQFGEGGGGKQPAAPSPANVSSTLTGIFKAGGFKKVKGHTLAGEAIYFNPTTGVKVKVHPAPEGKKWSSKWTSTKEGKADISGEGSALQKLLRVANEKAAAKIAPATISAEKVAAIKAAPDLDMSALPANTPKTEIFDMMADEGWLPAEVKDDGDYTFFNHNDEEGQDEIMAFNTKTNQGYIVDDYVAPAIKPSLTEQTITNVKAAGNWLKDMSYKPSDINGAEVIYEKPGAKVKYNAETGDWVAQTQGHMTKEGNGLADMQVLLGGNGVPKTVKNSQQVIQTSAEKAQQTEIQKKQAAQQSVAQKKHTEANALYTKMKDYAPQPDAGEQTAIAAYSGNSYQAMNDKLRHSPELAKTDAKVKSLDAYLKKSTIPETVVLRRGVSGEYAKILKSVIMEGCKFIDRGFISTSAKADWTWSGGLVFSITIPAGSKGAAIGKWSHHPSEMEVLLPRNSAFIVKAFDPDTKVVHVELDQSHL